MFHSVSLNNFRSYANKSYRFSSGVTVISGPNGSGKTNILEAVYVLCRGGSFRGGDEDMVKHNAPWWRVEAVWGDTSRVVTYDGSKATGKKHFIINGNKKLRLMPQMKLPVVLFEPEDLRLLKGSPSGRRNYIDTAIAQLEPGYQTYLRRYERALSQRNNLLKQPSASEDELFAWDVTLSENGAHIIDRRLAFIETMNRLIEEKYQSISHSLDRVTVGYSLAVQNNTLSGIQQLMMTALARVSEHDLRTGFTSVGPHRDDIGFTLNGRDASMTASRGETRSLVLALKQIELDLLLEHHTYTPILLLDDVFSELDTTRREGLLKTANKIQTILTTTDAEVLSSVPHTGHIALSKQPD